MTKGIFLTCFGNRAYYYAVYNFAVSIKHYNKDIQICLFHDAGLNNALPKNCFEVFDKFIQIPDETINHKGLRDAAFIKMSIYKHLPFDYNLVLDIDSIALNDLNIILEELIERGGNYYAPISGTHKIEQGNDIASMCWAWADDIWERYNLNEDSVLPSVNSSFQFIKKCDQTKELFERMLANYENKIPLNKLRTQWGASQPDELYLNISLAQMNINPDLNKSYIFFPDTYASSFKREDILKKHFIFSYFGPKETTKVHMVRFYDNEMIRYCRARGINCYYKFSDIKNGKHANKRPIQHPKPLTTVNVNYKLMVHNDYRILVKVAGNKRIESLIEKANNPEMFFQLISPVEDSQNIIQAFNRDIPADGWDIMITLTDNFVCEVQGWDDILRTVFNKTTDMYLHYNDTLNNNEICLNGVIGKRYYERFKYVYHPSYTESHSIAAKEQMQVAKNARRYFNQKLIMFKNTDKKNDATEKDTTNYNQRKSKNFPK